ncbi:hypothetical protein [Paraburkholderia tropica]|uniref:hypothetical protein n=1 Tax=Paraburkholderia tropica TaxID=92647 RepID=UPI002AB02BB8|nr:hypothetical protein [Paraburkholderia tropica]
MSGKNKAGTIPAAGMSQSSPSVLSPQDTTSGAQPPGEQIDGGGSGQNNDGENEERNDGKKEGRKLEELVSLAWKGLLFFGGIFLLIFFVDVGFFPDLKLPDLTATLSAVSLTGLLMLVLFAGSFVAPALMTRGSFAQLASAQRVAWASAFAGAAPAWILCGSLLLSGSWRSWGIFCAFALAVLLISLAIRFHIQAEDVPVAADVDGASAGQDDKEKAKVRSKEQWDRRIARGQVFGVAVAFFIGQLVATYYIVLARSSSNSGNAVFVIVLWPILCFIVNIGLLLYPDWTDEKRWRRTLGAVAGILLFAFFTLTSASSQLTGGIARRLALGLIPDASVMLTKDGCQIAEMSSGRLMQCKRKGEDVPGVVCHVTIVSRVGSEFVLRPQGADFAVVMRSTDVLGWASKLPQGFPSDAQDVKGDTAKNGSNKELTSLICPEVSVPVAASSPSVASSPNGASAPQSVSNPQIALSATALAEINATVQGAIVQAMKPHRRLVTARAHAPVAHSATNVFYDNHGQVTVNNLGATHGADQVVHTNAYQERD